MFFADSTKNVTFCKKAKFKSDYRDMTYTWSLFSSIYGGIYSWIVFNFIAMSTDLYLGVPPQITPLLKDEMLHFLPKHRTQKMKALSLRIRRRRRWVVMHWRLHCTLVHTRMVWRRRRNTKVLFFYKETQIIDCTPHLSWSLGAPGPALRLH